MLRRPTGENILCSALLCASHPDWSGSELPGAPERLWVTTPCRCTIHASLHCASPGGADNNKDTAAHNRSQLPQQLTLPFRDKTAAAWAYTSSRRCHPNARSTLRAALYAAGPTAGSRALPHGLCPPQEAARRTPAAPSPRTRAGRAGAAPAVPAAPRTAASRDGDGRGASLAGRPRPAPPSSPPPAASSSAGHSAGRRRRPSLSSPPLRPRRAVSLGQGSLRRLPGMANATAAPHPPRRRRRRHFAGEPAGTTPIGRRRTAPGRHWPRSARAGRRMRRGTAAGLQPLCSVLAPRAPARSPAARLGGKP